MFQKNLEVLNNDALKKRLEKISLTESKVNISYCVTPSKDYVMLKNELPTDDLNNPREAVKKMLAQNITTEMKTNDIIINFGLGLGYLLDETFNTYKSRILVYEPDLKFLHFVLNNVDILTIRNEFKSWNSVKWDEDDKLKSLLVKLGYTRNDIALMLQEF